MPSINKLLLEIPFVYTKALTESIKEDKTVINLARGDSEFQTPMPIIDYLNTVLPDKGDNKHDINTPVGKWTHYEKEKGSLRLRQAIVKKYKRESGIELDPDCILITQGGMNAIFYSFISILNHGDEILIPDPCYIAYDPIANYVIPGVKGKRIPLKEENNFILTVEQLENAKSDNTKALILTSPLNPTGSLYSEENLKDIMDWAIKNDIFVIHDENHEKEIYDGNIHHPIRKFDKTGEHSILLNSFSRLGMGGWRLGWLIGPKQVIKAVSLAHSYVNMTCNTFVQEAGVFVLDNYESLGFDKIFKDYQDKRDLLVSELNKLDGFECIKPMSTCYAFVNIRGFYEKYKNVIEKTVNDFLTEKMNRNPELKEKLTDEIRFASKNVSYMVFKFLLIKAKVGVIPGIAYGPNSDYYIRFSFSVKKDAILEAVNRLQQMSDELEKKDRK